MPITAEQVAERPTAYRFNGNSVGYTYVGDPKMPPLAVYAPLKTTPPEGVAHGSWHNLLIPGAEKTVPLQWLADKRLWTPGLASGAFRVAFSPAYLAAVGWAYGGPA
jgi:hypothetical protein